MQNQGQIKEVGLQLGIAVTSLKHVEEVLGQTQSGFGVTNNERLALERVPHPKVGVSHNHREAGYETDRLSYEVFGTVIFRLVVVGIQTQYGTRQHIHNALAPQGENEVLGKGEVEFLLDFNHVGEAFQLLFIGQFSRQQQIGHFFKTVATVALKTVHQVLYLVAPVVQLSVLGERHPIDIPRITHRSEERRVGKECRSG